MHKVDSAGATVQNEFTNGDLPGGVARTRLEAKWMNAVQRELCALVTSRGAALTDIDDNQLLEGLILHADDISTLRTFPVANNNIPITCYVRNVQSGYGMMYTWFVTSNAVDDGLTVIKPASNPALGRWLWSPTRDSLNSQNAINAATATNAAHATNSDNATNANNAGQLGGVAAGDHLAFRNLLGGGVDLNTFTTTGIWIQGTNLNAASGTNYPTPTAGKLEVVTGGGSGLIFQTYYRYDTLGVYVRAYYSGTGTWFAWRQLADTGFVQASIAALVNSSPAALDTLNELATAIANDPNFATTMTNALALKAPLNAPAFTGAATAPTQIAINNTALIATTNFVHNVLAANQNLNEYGYKVNDGGEIEQWGVIHDIAQSSTQLDISYSFPIAFPHACDNIQYTMQFDSRDSSGYEMNELMPADRSKTTTGAVLTLRRWGGSLGVGEFAMCSWRAKGY